MIGREEIDAADGGGARAFDRGIAIEALEIVVGAFLQALEQRAIVFIRGARTELIEAVRNAPLEIGNDPAEMMRDDLEIDSDP